MLPGKSYTFDDLLTMARRRTWLIVMPVLLAGLATAVFLLFLPDKYRSETLILVVPQRVPESYVKATVTTRIDDRLQSISQQILSRVRLERIIADFGLYARELRVGVMEDVVERMRADIKVQMVKNDAFKVAYVASDPQVAFKVTDRLASLFIEENLRDREVLAEATNQFLGTQLEDARRRLLEQEQQLQNYQLRYAGQLPSELQSNLQVVQTAQLQMQVLSDSTNRDRDRRLVLERAIVASSSGSDESDNSTLSPPGANASAVGVRGVAGQLETARRTLANLEARQTPRHPDVIHQKRVVDELEAALSAAMGERPATAGRQSAAAYPAASPAMVGSARKINDLKTEVAALDVQIASKEKQRRELESRISTYQGRLAAAPVREAELTSLTRDYDTLRKVYQDLLTKQEESKVAANLERRQIGEQFKVLDPARPPERPFSPNRPLLLLLGAAGGLAIAIGLVGWLEYRDTSIRTEDDVAATLALPVLATVPSIATLDDRRRRFTRTVFLSCVACTLAAVIGALALGMLHVHISRVL